MGRKVGLTLAIILLVSGIICGVTGLILSIRSKSDASVLDAFDPQSFTEGRTGILIIEKDGINQLEEDFCFYNAYRDDDNDGWRGVPISGFNYDKHAAGVFLLPQTADGNIRLRVKLRKASQETREKIINNIHDHYKDRWEKIKDRDDLSEELKETFKHIASDEGRKELDAGVSEYECVVISSETAVLTKIVTVAVILVAIGCILLIFVLLSYKFSVKRILAVTGILVLICMVSLAVILRKKLQTAGSLNSCADGVYTLNYVDDYKLDKLLESEVSDERELMLWISKNLFYGYPIQGDSFVPGCSAFAAVSPEGDHLMGRNTDYPECDTMVIYTSPKDGYASISFVDLEVLNIGRLEGQISPTSLEGRAYSLALPYAITDGMNEAGLGMSILQLNEKAIHQDNGKPDIMMNVAARAILDKCKDVDEAVSFLKSYDMQTVFDGAFHFHIADKSGRSVVVEWMDNEMIVTDSVAVTNYVVGIPDYYENEDYGDGRYEKLMEELDKCNSVADEDQAMCFLSEVGHDNRESDGNGTEWSCVYNLDKFEATACFDVKYDQPITFNRQTFSK